MSSAFEAPTVAGKTSLASDQESHWPINQRCYPHLFLYSIASLSQSITICLIGKGGEGRSVF
jgi:hypothetical protein